MFSSVCHSKRHCWSILRRDLQLLPAQHSLSLAHRVWCCKMPSKFRHLCRSSWWTWGALQSYYCWYRYHIYSSVWRSTNLQHARSTSLLLPSCVMSFHCRLSRGHWLALLPVLKKGHFRLVRRLRLMFCKWRPRKGVATFDPHLSSCARIRQNSRYLELLDCCCGPGLCWTSLRWDPPLHRRPFCK